MLCFFFVISVWTLIKHFCWYVGLIKLNYVFVYVCVHACVRMLCIFSTRQWSTFWSGISSSIFFVTAVVQHGEGEGVVAFADLGTVARYIFANLCAVECDTFTDYANMLYFCWPKYSSMYIFANLFAVVYLCWLSYSSLLYLCWPRHSSVTYFHWPRYSGVPFFCWPRHSSVTHSSVTCCHWPTFSSISTIVCHTFSDRGTAVCHTFADILQQCAIHLPT